MTASYFKLSNKNPANGKNQIFQPVWLVELTQKNPKKVVEKERKKVRCQVSSVRCQVSDDRCKVSGVRYQVSHVLCHVSPVTQPKKH